ncbi:MAG: hyaluronate lyase [Microgenomates group bacterium Gr01-1014_93]|nr:MAG: hyaluronate lyase [Microgenomates group bacterium Gr01-1014_93]
MPKILTFNNITAKDLRQKPIKGLREVFKSQDFFTKLIFISAIFFIIIAVYFAKNLLTTKQYALQNRIYFGSYISGFPTDTSKIDTFEGNAGKKLSIVNIKQQWAGSDSSFNPGNMNIIRTRGSIPMITWEPWQRNLTDSSYNLQNIIKGNFDGYIAKFAQDTKQWTFPFFLRFAPNMNQRRFSWSEGVNGNNAGDYVAAWKHVYEIFRNNSVTNATWVWSPMVETATDSGSFESFYPGNDFVNWVGLGGYYSASLSANAGWNSFNDTFKSSYDKIVSLVPDKAIMISEFSAAQEGPDKASWITDALNQISTNYTKVKAIVWYNEKNKDGDFRIGSSQQSIEAFSNAIKAPFYLKNDFALFNTVPIPTPAPFVRQVSAVPTDTYSKIRSAWADYLTGGDYDVSSPIIDRIRAKVNQVAQSAKATKVSMITAPDRTFLFNNIQSPGGGPGVSDAYDKLRTMAVGLATKDAIADQAEREQIYLAIKDGLIWLNQNWYNKDKCPGNKFNYGDRECGQSLPYQVGASKLASETIVLIFDELKQDPQGEEIIKNTMDAVERFYPKGNANRFYPNGMRVHDTAGNLAMATLPLILRAAILEDQTVLSVARDNYYNDFLQYKVSGDGLYKDGSFIQHDNHPYSNWYGRMFYKNVVEIGYLLSSTGENPNFQRLYSFYKDAYEPIIFNNEGMDIVKGRMATAPRRGIRANDDGIIWTLLTLSRITNGTTYQSLGREFLQRTNRRLLGGRLTFLLWQDSLIQDSSLNGSPPIYSITKIFPRMDRAVMIKPDFGVALSMSSARTFNYEAIRGVNKKGWYMGSGMVYLYKKSDPGQYNDYFWATVDKTKLAGTTVDEQIRLDTNNNYVGANFDAKFSNYLTPRLYAGGASLDGFASLGMNTKSFFAKPVMAKKSWFMFDDEIVAIGSQIKATSATNVVTVVENRKIANDNSNRFVVNGASISTPTTITNPQYAYLSGTGGYYFPPLAGITSSLTVQKQARTGNWEQLGQGTGADSATRNFAQMWFNHGVNTTTNSKYAYVLLPTKTEEQTRNYASSPNIRIIANTNTAQAAEERTLKVSGFNFFSAKGAVAEYLKANERSSVILRQDGNKLRIGFADPTQARGTVILELSTTVPTSYAYNKTYSVSIPNDKVNINLQSDKITFTVDFAGSKGQTLLIELKEGAGQSSALKRNKKTIKKANPTPAESNVVDEDEVSVPPAQPSSESDFEESGQYIEDLF